MSQSGGGTLWRVFAAGLLLFNLSLTGCHKKPEVPPPGPPPQKIMDITEEAIMWADSVVNAMSLEQQAAQLLMPAVFAKADATTLEQIRIYAEDMTTGGLLLLKGDAESAAIIADSLESIRGRVDVKAGYIVAVDAETGLGMRFSDAPLFPWNRDIPPEVTDQTFYDYGREVGREARLAGINMVLGPVVDVDRNVRGSGVMKKRSFGSDQLRVADLSLAYAAGLESQKVISVAKHFPGHGPTSTDSHDGMPKITTPEDEIYSIDLMPFRSYIANGLTGIMVGHLWVEALDSVRRPASFSPRIIKQLLRKEMEFRGLVLVDAMNMGGAKGYTAADAISAGADVIISPENPMEALMEIVGAVQAGSISPGDIREKAKRILFYKYLFNIPFSRRDNHDLPADEIKERLREEALPILDSLKRP